MGDRKNITVVGIVEREDEDLFKIVVWDNAYLDIAYKICSSDELLDMISDYDVIGSLDPIKLKKNIVTVPFVDLLAPMLFAWVEDPLSFMYSYFDCLRWCLSENIPVFVGDVEITRENLVVDLEKYRVTASGKEIFSWKNKDDIPTLTIDLSDVTPEQYDMADKEFYLDGTECVIEYKPIGCISSRNCCSILRSYAEKQDCIGKLYALDQILGEL